MLLPLLILFALALHGLADLDDPALARRIRDGDSEAFRAFFDRYHGLLFRYLRRRGVPGAVCEDLLQVAFLAIWERRTTIDPQQSLRAFLFRIAHNRALNHFRDTARFTDATTHDHPVAPARPDAEADYARMQETLCSAIAALPERRRVVFELCFLHDLTYRETAEVLGISVKTVENQMGHALKAVRTAMEMFR